MFFTGGEVERDEMAVEIADAGETVVGNAEIVAVRKLAGVAGDAHGDRPEGGADGVGGEKGGAGTRGPGNDTEGLGIGGEGLAEVVGGKLGEVVSGFEPEGGTSGGDILIGLEHGRKVGWKRRTAIE